MKLIQAFLLELLSLQAFKNLVSNASGLNKNTNDSIFASNKLSNIGKNRQDPY